MLFVLFGQIQPVDLGFVTDLKFRYSDDAADLISSSPMVTFKLPTYIRKLAKPVTVRTHIFIKLSLTYLTIGVDAGKLHAFLVGHCNYKRMCSSTVKV